MFRFATKGSGWPSTFFEKSNFENFFRKCPETGRTAKSFVIKKMSPTNAGLEPFKCLDELLYRPTQFAGDGSHCIDNAEMSLVWVLTNCETVASTKLSCTEMISDFAARSNFFYLCSSSRHNYFSDAFTFSPGFYISSCFSFFGISCLFHFLSRFDITVSVFVNCELWLVQLIRGKGGKDKRKFFSPSLDARHVTPQHCLLCHLIPHKN